MDHATQSQGRRSGLFLASTIAATSWCVPSALARALEIHLADEDGITLTLALADADFADPSFNGTLVFVGEILEADGSVIPTTITMTAAELGTLLPFTATLGSGAVVIAATPEMSSATLFEFVPAGDPEASTAATAMSLFEGIEGTVSVCGEFVDLRSRVPGLGATSQSMATRMTHTLAMVVGFVPLAQDAPEAEPSFKDCYAAAKDGCTRHCSNTGKTVHCIKDFSWSSAGGCSFECDTLEACCNAHP